jgi:hypothetical protein
MKNQSLQSKLMFGALIGAGMGLAVAWVMAGRSDSESTAGSDKPEKPVSLNEVVGLGFALLKVARQASAVARKI